MILSRTFFSVAFAFALFSGSSCDPTPPKPKFELIPKNVPSNMLANKVYDFEIEVKALVGNDLPSLKWEAANNDAEVLIAQDATSAGKAKVEVKTTFPDCEPKAKKILVTATLPDRSQVFELPLVVGQTFCKMPTGTGDNELPEGLVGKVAVTSDGKVYAVAYGSNRAKPTSLMVFASGVWSKVVEVGAEDVRSLAVKDKDICIGTEGKIHCTQNEAWHLYDTSIGLPNYSISGIVFTDNKINVGMGTSKIDRDGAYLLDLSTPQANFVPAGVTGWGVSAMVLGPDDNIWYGAFRNRSVIIRKERTGKETEYDGSEWKASGQISVSAFGSDAAKKLIWMGLDKSADAKSYGLVRVEPSAFDPADKTKGWTWFSQTEGVPTSRVTSILVIGDEVWFGTLDGVWRMVPDATQPKGYRATKVSHPSLELIIFGIAVSGDSLWVGGYYGLTRVWLPGL